MWIIVRLLIGIAILTIVEVYFLRKAGHSIKILFPAFFKRKYKPIKWLFIGWLNLYPLVLIFVYIYFAITSAFITAPDIFLYDYLLVYPFWILFILMAQTSIYFLIMDLLKLILFPFFRKRKHQIHRVQAIVVTVLIGFFLIYIPSRVIYDYNSVSVRSTIYSNKNMPSPLNNFKIAFISDIQADRYTDIDRLRNYVNEINHIKPDLVLIAGDFITTGPDYIKISGQEVGRLAAKYGVYSCVGDHDNWAYRNDYEKSRSEVKASLKNNKVEMVDNDKRKIEIDDAVIEITFITNTYVGRVPDSILDSLSSNGKGDLKIFLTHQPREYLIDAAVKNNFDLFLAGHTHGGQLTLLFPFIQLTPTLFETSYVKGDFWFGNTLMIVTRGLGMSLAPLRYNSTPEVTLITLQNK